MNKLVKTRKNSLKKTQPQVESSSKPVETKSQQPVKSEPQSVSETQPQVQPTQDDSIISKEEADRIIQEVGIGTPEGDIITGEEELGGDIDSADFNWHQ